MISRGFINTSNWTVWSPETEPKYVLWKQLTDKKKQNAPDVAALRELDFSGMSDEVPFKLKRVFLLMQPQVTQINFRVLDLSNTNINRSHIRQLGSFLQQYRKLEELNLDNNAALGGNEWPRFFYGESGVEVLANSLHGYDKLKKLSLNYVNRDREDTQALIGMMDSRVSSGELLVQERFSSFRSELDQAKTHAHHRAALLDPSSPQLKSEIRDDLRRIIRYYIAKDICQSASQNQKSQIESKDCDISLLGGNRGSSTASVSLREMYELTRKMINLFVPGSSRLKFIEGKEKQNKSLSPFEGLQWRSIVATKKINEIKLPAENDQDPEQKLKLISDLQDVWAGFILGAELTTYTAEKVPFVFNSLQEWLEVIMAAQGLIHSAPLSVSPALVSENSEWPDYLKYIEARWFRAQFEWAFGSLWSTSGPIYGGVLNVANPLTKPEKVMKHLNKVGFHAFLAIPAIGELGSALFHGARAFHEMAELEMLPEITHAREFIESLTEAAEDIPAVHHFLHGVNNLPRKLIEKITDKRWLNTKERLENLYKSFVGQKDYNAKIGGLIRRFIQSFDDQLFDLEPLDAGLFGKACARHLLEGLMLGFFRGSPDISEEKFISQAFRWLTYIPMKSPPWLKLKKGHRVSADTLLRGAALRGQANNKAILFHWSEFNIEILGDYRKYLWNSNPVFRYRADPQKVQPRKADIDEINQLNLQLWGITEYNDKILGVELGREIAKLSWVVDKDRLEAMRKAKITEVSTELNKLVPSHVKMDLMQKQIERQQTEIRELQEQKDSQVVVNDKLQNRIVELEKRVNNLQPIPVNKTDVGNVEMKSENSQLPIPKHRTTFFHRSSSPDGNLEVPVKCYKF